ncbi:hypothetical protein GCM10010168_59700 [Actinoplanes ianthinogenes]|uniref:DUF3592 domain-containing protein n=1 Tax=Actinoplanes ianthinogenes TaxID=122358 RepID=A0ABN6CML6_9ACTN|nr:hypothetical protein [Actinoplanes ianthinogenes]BCJ46331.1 hypothetical protein Aiant_69880 [Actinoplanes ianthinogenes]GGR33553.1 hypothetical protein GCM10010168_59700 [Actinoplanes ianthinogenes]
MGAPEKSRRRRVTEYVCRTSGVLIFLLWLVPVVAGQAHVTYISRSGEPVPPGASFYLSTYATTPLTCDITPEHGPTRAVALEPIRSIWRLHGLLGTRVDRWFDGPAVITCDPPSPEARMVAGPLQSLFPLADGILVPIAAFVLVVIGWGDFFLPWRTPRRGPRRGSRGGRDRGSLS